jgi:hypothetical protein
MTGPEQMLQCSAPAASGGFTPAARPPSPVSQEARILMALGRARGPLPRVSLSWLAGYPREDCSPVLSVAGVGTYHGSPGT